jgi:thiosulfate/3-mercaptopyruvate sulfurtransferase
MGRMVMRPIVSVDELAVRLSDSDLRLCDVRWYLGRPGDGRRAYETGHLPGAIFVDLDIVLADPPGPAGRHPLPDPGRFARELGGLGIGNDHLVIAYDDGGGTIAARLWWMLDALGHERVAVLDGGLAAWVGSGRPVVTEEPSLTPTRMDLAHDWPTARTIGRHGLAERLGEVALLDVRAPERYRGDVEPIDPVAGHIPTAISAPLDGNLDATGRFLPGTTLRDRYRALAGDRPIVVQCGSGVNACQAALAVRLAGLPEAILYPGSYSEWSRAGAPVVTGDEPGDPAAGGRP